MWEIRHFRRLRQSELCKKMLEASSTALPPELPKKTNRTPFKFDAMRQVHFYSPHSPECSQLAPTMERLAEGLQGVAKVRMMETAPKRWTEGHHILNTS